MSLTSKSTLSLKKKDVQQQKKAGTAYRRLVFAHKASAGETGVTFTSLVQPSEMAALGFTNPSSSDILAANILFYKKNLTVISSARGVLMQDLSYTIPTSSRIEFQGFTSLDGEIFTCLLETGVRDGLNIVDASPIIATGELAIGATDFNVGVPFEVNKYSAQQVGAVLVFRDGVVQFRNPSNGTTGGNYQEVDNGGLATLIRFNDAPVSEASQIVVWGNLMSERPDGSMMAAIESIAGQLDQMIPTLAALAGVPTTTFQAQPNNQDLKAFGDKVQALEGILDLEIPNLTATQTYVPTITSTGTPPTKGTTTYDVARWSQNGEYLEWEYDYLQPGATGSNGTGTYKIPLPVGLTIDTTLYPIQTVGAVERFVGQGVIGDATNFANSTQHCYLYVISATEFGVMIRDGLVTANSPWVAGTTNCTFALDALRFSFKARVKISGWTATQTVREALGL